MGKCSGCGDWWERATWQRHGGPAYIRAPNVSFGWMAAFISNSDRERPLEASLSRRGRGGDGLSFPVPSQKGHYTWITKVN